MTIDDLVKPGPNATDAERLAYQAAYNSVAMAEYKSQQMALRAELVEKVQAPDAARALAAFNSVLQAAGVDAWSAASGQFKLESWDDCGFPEGEGPSEAECKAGEVWCNAVEAGQVELCDKAPFVSGPAFGLVDFIDRPRVEYFEASFSLHRDAQAKPDA